MHNYLSNVTADYTATELTVTPTTVLTTTGDKVQYVHDFDDGSISVVTANSTSVFNVELQWELISAADHTTIMDFWHNNSKAGGRENTFYWLNPVDGYTYTVRFLTPLITQDMPGLLKSITAISMRVLGNKP